jgi:DUF1009 family protein
MNKKLVENRSFGRLGAAIAKPNINEIVMLGYVSLHPTKQNISFKKLLVSTWTRFKCTV